MAAAALGASFIGPAAAQATGAASLRIGLYLPVGPAGPGAYDRAALRGLDLWACGAEASNRDHGDDRPLPLLTIGAGDGGREAIRTWYRDAAVTVDALVTPYGSGAASAAFDAAEAARIPCLAPSAGSSALWDAPPRWCVGLLEPTPTFFHGTLRRLASRRPHALALVHRDDAFSIAVMDGAEAEARRLGFGAIRRRSYASDADRTAAARATAEPTVLAIGWIPGAAGDGFLDDALALARALPRRPGTVVALGVGGADPAFARRLRARADGILGVTGWRPYLPTPGNHAFAAAYRLRWVEDPDAHAAQGFAAAQVLEQAARRARKGTGTRRERIRTALHALDVETIFGRYRVDGHGMQVGHEPALVRWHDGRALVLPVPPPTTS